ncbi:hypothetical protein FAGAP_4293 [Fusarium agapanthi]|uniref:Uncharacterized protein n=1 Tax=Fusarium agapanthi TaxID=1803897 RepID=A0A9P5BDS5_9HYPO|nr:hypothetical protein FAGAP_4293 [Fusarium agapanthi]
MDVITIDRLNRQRGVILAMVVLVLVGLVVHIYALIFSPAYGTMKVGRAFIPSTARPFSVSRRSGGGDLDPSWWTVGDGRSGENPTEWDTDTKPTINKEVNGSSEGCRPHLIIIAQPSPDRTSMVEACPNRTKCRP